jgi:hypothetical protein
MLPIDSLLAGCLTGTVAKGEGRAQLDLMEAGKTLRYSNYQTTRSRLATLAAAIS